MQILLCTKHLFVCVCVRSQIVTVLQQVKSERGTVAGMSIEEIKQQVEQKLAQNQRPVS